MIDTMGMMLSGLKIDEMKQSYADEGSAEETEPEQPKWLSKQIGRVLQAVGNEITNLGEHLSHEPHTALTTPAQSSTSR